MSDFFTAFFLFVGSLLIAIAAIGLVRLPDALCRSHALAKALVLGIVLMFIGYWVNLREHDIALKIILAIATQFLTIPIAGHLLALLVFEKKLPRWKERPMDEPHA